MHIKIKIVRIENVILFKILKMNGIDFDNFEWYCSETGITVKGTDRTQFYMDTLYLGEGAEEKYEYEIFQCASVREAVVSAERIGRTIALFNECFRTEAGRGNDDYDVYIVE